MVPRRLRGTQSDPRLRGDKFCQRGCGLRPAQCGNGALAGLREAPLPTLIWGPLKGYCGPVIGQSRIFESSHDARVAAGLRHQRKYSPRAYRFRSTPIADAVSPGYLRGCTGVNIGAP